jgi:hypothetical protein
MRKTVKTTTYWQPMKERSIRNPDNERKSRLRKQSTTQEGLNAQPNNEEHRIQCREKKE